MQKLNIIVGLFNVHAGLLGALLSFLLIRRKVEPNRWLGIRIKQAFASEENWYRINAYGGRWMMYASLLLMLTGALSFFMSSADESGLLLAALGPLSIFVLAVMDICRYARNL